MTLNSLRVCGYMVTDERGYESLHKDHARADTYAIDHLRHGLVEPLVALSAVAKMFADMLASDEED